MAGVMMNNSIPYDPFSTSYLIKDQQTFDYSPIALYSIPQEFSGPEFSGTGPAASSPELDSPLSPDSFSLPTANSAGNEWTSPFDRIESSDAFFKSESFDSPVLGSIPLQSLSSSPAINPMELSTAPVVMNDDVPFGGSEGGLMADSDPLFPSPQLARAQNPGHVNHYAPSNNNNNNNTVKSEITVTTRQSKRNNHSMKRKSSSSSSSSSGRSSASPPPPPPATSRPGLTRRATAPGNHTTGAGKEQGNSNSNSNGGGNGNGNAQAHHVSLPPKKTAHNMIEKRYRNNLNDKISALRDAVPALRVMVHRLETHHSGEAGSEDEMEGMEGADGGVNGRRMTAQDFEEDLGGLAPAHKLNKATILSKATEYIAHLERKNRALARENQGLRSKVEGFEMLMMNGAARTVWC